MSPGKHDNIIFIMPDEWRFDALGAAGNSYVRTPTLDSLARAGFRFSNTFCDSPVCQPSRASLMTGMTVRRHGLTDNEMSRYARGRTFPAPSTGTFMQELQAAGYLTMAVGKLNVGFPEWELAKEQRDGWAERLTSKEDLRALFGARDIREFESGGREYGIDVLHEEGDKQSLLLFNSRYTDHLRRIGELEAWRDKVFGDSGDFIYGMLTGGDAPMYGPGGPAVAEHLASKETLDGFIAGDAMALIGGHTAAAPFFLWVCFAGPHPPFDAPPEASRDYDEGSRLIAHGPTNGPVAPDNAWGQYVQWVRRRSGSEGLRPSERAQIVRQYYSGCSLIDSQVREILGLLEKRGLASSTWIIFGSDHGELLGDYGLIQKRLFYPGSVQVPLLVVPPAGRNTREASGMSYDFLVQNVDLSATILDIAGVRPFFRDGRSLLAQMSNAKARRRVAISEIADFTMVFDGVHRLIYETATREPQSLVNVRSDPEEIADLLSSSEGRSTADVLLRLEEAERAREMEGAV